MDYIALADYSEAGKLEKTVFVVLDLICAQNVALEMNFKDFHETE